MLTVRMLAVCAAAAGLSGCAPGMMGPSPYQQGLYDLRTTSMAAVYAYDAPVAQFIKSNGEDAAIEKAKSVVADSLRDPASAQFRNVRVVSFGQGSVICGEVNGKNAYGGYVGFVPFAAGITSAQIASYSSKHPEINAAGNAGVNAACG